MKPGIYDITVSKGASFSISMDATDEQGALNFSTVYTKASLLVWPAWALQKGISGDPLLEMSTENARIILGTGITLQLSPPETAALTFKEGIYTLKLINDADLIKLVDPYLTGKFFVGDFT